MRLAGLSGGACAVAVAAQGGWGYVFDEKFSLAKLGRSRNDLVDRGPRILGQQRIDAVVAEKATTQVVSEVTETRRIIETTVNESHPRITEAPIFRRKVGWDLIHDGIQVQKRDATSCPVDYQLCPQSLGGGCCPNDRACGTSSCYAKSAAPASACGQAGYIACGVDQGGGCCPSDYSCAMSGCMPLTSVSYTQTCEANSYLCPASLNYGCCKIGMACGLNNCYSTAVETYTLVETFTTTSSGQVEIITSTTVGETTPPTPSAAATTPNNVVPKVTFTPTAIAKTAPSSPSTSGLTTPQLDGIIAGAVIILVILLIVAFIIIRRLNKVNKAVKARSRTSSSSPHSWNSRRRLRETPDMETMSIDPLIMTPSEFSRSVYQPSQPSAIHSTAYEVEDCPRPPFDSPHLPRSPPHGYHPGGYVPIASSDSLGSGYKNQSFSPTPGNPQNPNDSFDIPPHRDLRDQNLWFGHSAPRSPFEIGRRPSQHERQWSGSSSQSQDSSGMSELDAGGYGRDGVRRLSLQRALHVFGMGRALSMRRKPEIPRTSDPPRQPIPLAGWNKDLGHIAEVAESRPELDHGSTDMESRGPNSVER